MHLYLYRNIFVIKHTSWKMKAHETKSSFWTAFSLNDAFFQTSAWSEIRKHQKWDQRYPASQVTMATLSSLVTYCCLYCSTLHYTTSLNHWYNQDVSMLSRCLARFWIYYTNVASEIENRKLFSKLPSSNFGVNCNVSFLSSSAYLGCNQLLSGLL